MLNFIKENFATTKNDELAQHCGISLSKLHTIARAYGLTKTADFMAMTQRAASAAGAKVVRAMSPEQKKRRIQAARNSPNARHFEKGHNLYEGKSEEYRKEVSRKRTESWKKTRQLEQARVDFNLPQRTKFRFALFTNPLKNKKMYQMRYYLKFRGYVVNGFSVSFTDNTKRTEGCENKAKELGFIFNYN